MVSLRSLHSLGNVSPSFCRPVPSTPLIRPILVLSIPPDSRPRAFFQPWSRKSLLRASACQYILSLAQEARSGGRENAKERWQRAKGNPLMVPRVVDVVKDELCWIVGQPNILGDIQRDVTTVLEDECGRISLVGERLAREQYVMGIIMAALGIETPDAPPPVANLKWTSCAGMAPHAGMENVGSKAENDMDFDVPVAGPSVSTLSPSGSWIALLSRLLVLTLSPPLIAPAPRHMPHRVPPAAPGRTAPPTDRRARTRIRSAPRIPRAARPGRQRSRGRAVQAWLLMRGWTMWARKLRTTWTSTYLSQGLPFQLSRPSGSWIALLSHLLVLTLAPPLIAPAAPHPRPPAHRVPAPPPARTAPARPTDAHLPPHPVQHRHQGAPHSPPTDAHGSAAAVPRAFPERHAPADTDRDVPCAGRRAAAPPE
ncbi:hypothetical protein JB92DRAFT_3107986 [Gautieria morchelliformis]|nr:hypothetical protein JB92DRAFT_3107986 [Gautieria morchelliformis]